MNFVSVRPETTTSPRVSAAPPSSVTVSEELWFGRGDDGSEQRAADSLAARVGRILGAKPFPESARRLDQLTRGPACPIDDVVRVLEGDPALSARLLRLVNSAGYALRMRCTSVRHAAVLVGTRRLNQLATTAAVLDMFDASTATAARVVEHASVVGSVCRYLAVHLGLPRDELATCGFLHDIGKLMLLETEGKDYARLLDEHGQSANALHPFEREIYGFDHAVLGAHVLAAWNIPDPVPKVVAWHHEPTRAYQVGGMLSAMVQALRLADAMAYELASESGRDAAVRLAQTEMASYLEISEAQLAAMWSDVEGLGRAAQSRGTRRPDPEILPRRDSLSTKSQRVVSRVPKHFPCAVCAKASFGTTCTACGAFACPEHLIGPEQWCAVCEDLYRRGGAVSSGSWGSIAGGSSLAAFASGVAAMLAGSSMGGSLFVAVLSALFAATLLAVGGRARRRVQFLRERAKERSDRSPAAAEESVERIEVPVLPPPPQVLPALPASPPTSLSPALALEDPRRSAVTDPAPAFALPIQAPVVPAPRIEYLPTELAHTTMSSEAQPAEREPDHCAGAIRAPASCTPRLDGAHWSPCITVCH